MTACSRGNLILYYLTMDTGHGVRRMKENVKFFLFKFNVFFFSFEKNMLVVFPLDLN